MLTLIRRLTLSLLVGCVIGWGMWAKGASAQAVGAGTLASAAVMYGGFVYLDRSDRREAKRRSTEDAEAEDAA